MNPDETTSEPQLPQNATPGGSPGWDTSGLLGLINGVIAAIGGVYASTRSIPITVLAGGAAMTLAVLVIRRK